MKYYIYKATFSNKKVYIGITVNFERRVKEHKRGLTKKDKLDYPFYQAILKYGWKDISWEIIEEVEGIDLAKEKEIYYIKEYNSYQKGGYNATKGGDYPSKLVYSYEQEVIDQVVDDLKENKLTYYEISNKYNMCLSHISNIANGKTRGVGKIKRKSLQSQKGSNNPSSKLNESQVSEIKKRLIKGESRKVLQNEFNVSKSLIQSIAVGNWWGHVEPKIPMKKKITKMDKDKLTYIKEELAKGRTGSSIMKELSMSPSTISKIKKGEYDHLLE